MSLGIPERHLPAWQAFLAEWDAIVAAEESAAWRELEQPADELEPFDTVHEQEAWLVAVGSWTDQLDPDDGDDWDWL